MLQLTDVNVHYGGIHAVKGVTMHVSPGSIVTLIGANGAGKSTILRAVSGLVRQCTGSIAFLGRPILGLRPHDIVKRGLTMSPEGRRIFPNLTVKENLALGSYSRTDRAGVADDEERVFRLFPRLKERISQPGGTLSGGEQQMLAVARALMSRPKLLMLDEPSLGLAPVLTQEIFEIITTIRNEGTTILLIEQNAFGALSIADYGYVLENGRIALEGPGKELLGSQAVQGAYLGARVGVV
ncbi:MAG: High-affinity branched-chain amino acid transport ATP-binding protein LivF [Firmicutes bacterium ADurb.Bin506]|jgi:branched-chain amino acid transport system ATP-binding protein|nr:MAG: High-affinity branched-chain amino acid transport ATP-binding protein LivF [Firmicutes bacterium ADurb.Bin506]